MSTQSKKSYSRYLLVAMAVFILGLASLFAGCGKQDEAAKAGDKKPTVVVTTSFLADMVHQLAGDTVNVETIIPAGDDPHLYVAKPQDIQEIQKADLVLYHGLHFEGKMLDALEKKGHAVTINFRPEDVGQMEEDGKTITDPHFWFNIDLYSQAVQEVAKQLINLEPKQKDLIEKNEKNYLQKLAELKKYAEEQFNSIPKEQRYLVTPHDAFNYFSREYNFPVIAPQGVSTESEVSNKAIEDTAQQIVNHHIKAIFAESTTDPARMKKLQEVVASKGHHVKVVEGPGQELFSDSLAPKGQPGDTYIDMYKHNIDLITKNLK